MKLFIVSEREKLAPKFKYVRICEEHQKKLQGLEFTCRAIDLEHLHWHRGIQAKGVNFSDTCKVLVGLAGFCHRASSLDRALCLYPVDSTPGHYELHVISHLGD